MTTRRLLFVQALVNNAQQLRQGSMAGTAKMQEERAATFSKVGRVISVDRANGGRVFVDGSTVDLRQIGHTALSVGKVVRVSRDENGKQFILA